MDRRFLFLLLLLIPMKAHANPNPIYGTVQTYTTQTITINTTWINQVNITSGTIITINSGVTLTINGVFLAGPYPIFKGSGSVQFGQAFQGVVYPEWWGARSDGVNDDALAISSASLALVHGGIIQLQAKPYTLKTPINIVNQNVTLQGVNIGPSPYDNGGGLVNGTQLLGTNGVTGISVVNTVYTTIQDLDISLAVGATSASTAINLNSCFLARVIRVRTTNYSTGIHLTASTDSFISQSYLSSISVTVSPVVGIDIDGSSHVQNPTVFVDHVISAAGLYSGSSYGYWLHGNRIGDVHFSDDEADGATYGFYIDCSAGLDTGYGDDIFVNSCSADSNVTYGYFVNQCNNQTAINIDNSWASGGTDGVLVSASQNVNVRGTQDYLNTNGIVVLNSSNTIVSDNNILYASANSVEISNSPSCTVNHNECIEDAAGTDNCINVLAGSSYTVILGNVATGIAGSFSSGITLNPGVDFCSVVGNAMPVSIVTTPYTFSGGANTVSYNFGSSQEAGNEKINNLTAGTLDSDAANVGQLVTVSTVTTSTNTWSASQTISSFTATNMTVTGSAAVVKSTTNSCGYLIGSVVNVVSFTTVTDSATTVSNFIPTNVTASIAPKCATDAIFVTTYGAFGIEQKLVEGYATIERGTTNLMGTSGGAVAYNQTDTLAVTNVSMKVYDHPATTSSTAYTVYIKNSDNATTIDFPGGLGLGVQGGITLMDVAN
jgi:hypothetical protein